MTATDSSGQCAGGKEIVVFDVTLDVEKTLLTLKHDRECALEVNVTPSNTVYAQRYQIEIKRTNSSTWCVLITNRTMSPWFSNIAGQFDLRGAAKIDNHWHYSSNVFVQVQFPSYNQIVDDSEVQSMTASAWADTLADCTETPNRFMERGFWILLDTDANSYGHGIVVLGAWSVPDSGASVVLPARPSDGPLSPAPNAAGAIYPVASFHTHPPPTYATNQFIRPVGPSRADNEADSADKVPGIVYDYIESPAGSGTIPSGHPKNAPAKRYYSAGLERRELQ